MMIKLYIPVKISGIYNPKSMRDMRVDTFVDILHIENHLKSGTLNRNCGGRTFCFRLRVHWCWKRGGGCNQHGENRLVTTIYIILTQFLVCGVMWDLRYGRAGGEGDDGGEVKVGFGLWCCMFFVLLTVPYILELHFLGTPWRVAWVNQIKR